MNFTKKRKTQRSLKNKWSTNRCLSQKSRKYFGDTFISDPDSTSHMSTLYEKSTKLNDKETRLTIGDTIKLTGKNIGDLS